MASSTSLQLLWEGTQARVVCWAGNGGPDGWAEHRMGGCASSLMIPVLENAARPEVCRRKRLELTESCLAGTSPERSIKDGFPPALPLIASRVCLSDCPGCEPEKPCLFWVRNISDRQLNAPQLVECVWSVTVTWGSLGSPATQK